MLATLEVARQSLLLNLRSRLLWVIFGVVMVAPLALLFLPHPGRVSAHWPYFFVSVVAGLTLLVPLMTLFFATQAVQGDLEDRTSTYLFVRPINRALVLLGKWLATVGLGGLVVLVGATSVYVVIAYSGRGWRGGLVPDVSWWVTFTLAGAMMVVGYASIGCLIAAVFKRPMIVAILFWVGWEQVVSRLPPQAGVRSATVWDPIRRWIYGQLVGDVHFKPKMRDYLVGDLMNFEIPLEALGNPLVTLLKFTLVTLGLAMFIYWRREYDSRPRD